MFWFSCPDDCDPKRSINFLHNPPRSSAHLVRLENDENDCTDKYKRHGCGHIGRPRSLIHLPAYACPLNNETYNDQYKTSCIPDI